DIVSRRPRADGLLIETFGSPFSPLNESELQIAFVRALDCPSVLVSSSRLGAIGRTLQCLVALEAHGHRPGAVVLLGPTDDYAIEQISRHHPGQAVFGLTAPEEWTMAEIARCAVAERAALQSIGQALAPKA